ncbi:MAG TPA: SDR family NAD(P)-dependent oxidoreductase, partial [Acidimicrobiales bacterium]
MTVTSDRRALLQDALQAIDALQARLDHAERRQREPIAIIGMSCRFPGGATSPEAFWQLLRDGRDAISEYPADRVAMVEAAGIDGEAFDGARAFGGFLDQIDQFDPQFFGISPREAATMDPQQRLVLEVSWEALERAGIAPDSLHGSSTGVFVGITTNEYVQLAKAAGREQLDVYSATGGAMNAAAGRVAYTLGLHGPCMAIDTACSSSLVALHQACQSLRLGESTMALAGGVNLLLLPEAFVCFDRWGMMASDGRCKTFDAAADGFVRAEGCGMLVLKRLADAQADRDPVLAVIRGSAVNQDGHSSGLTVPNGPAQQAVVRRALEAAGVAPADVQYVEAHGTGTSLGDPIEVEALGAVLGTGRSEPLVLGSVKTNIGHLESAAGIAGVIKVVLSMQKGEIPPHLHFHARSPQIPWPAFPIVVPTDVTAWPGRDGRRVAGVSGFGFSGTNAHVVLESAPADRPAGPQVTGTHLLALSARSETALREQARCYASWLAHGDPSLADVCGTANAGRVHFGHRAAVVAHTADELRVHLEAVAAGRAGAGVAHGQAARPKVAFVFTGQGAQYAGMARGLYDAFPVFRDALDHCAELFDERLDVPLLEVAFATDGIAAARLVDETAYTQPALFALEHSLVQLWQSWGVTPHALLGHSVGEYVAAVAAGVFSLEDAVRLVAARGRLMQALPAGGAMAAVFAPATDVEVEVARYAESLAVAAVNGPAHTVISGSEPTVAAASEVFSARGLRVQSLTVSHAFHSPLMEPMLDAFADVARQVAYHRPHGLVISNVTGEPIGEELAHPHYWVRHVRQPVRFAAGVDALRRSGIDTFVEVGPHPVLSGMARAGGDGDGEMWVPSLRRNHNDVDHVLGALATMYVRGAPIHWDGLAPPDHYRRVALPTSAFERRRCWVEAPLSGRRGHRRPAGSHPLLGTRTDAPSIEATIFEAQITPADPPWLGDHRLSGTAVFPGTAYVEMVLAACGDGDTIEQLSIDDALVLADETVTMVQTVVTTRKGERRVEIISSHGDDPSRDWRRHARAVLGPVGPMPAPVDIARRAESYDTEIDVDDYYRTLHDVGLTYGPAFRGLSRLRRRDGAALGLVTLPAEAGDTNSYVFHPALLDACFQVAGAALPPVEDSDNRMFVPVGLTGVRLHRRSPSSAWCEVTRLDEADASTSRVAARLDLYDAHGAPVASIDRLEMARVPRSHWQRNRTVSSALYELAWRPPSRPEASDEARAWVVFADGGGIGRQLAERLTAGGMPCVTVVPGSHTAEVAAGHWELAAGDHDGLESLLRPTVASAPVGVAYLWGLDAAEPVSASTLVDDTAAALGGALALAQALVGTGRSDARLWLVTRGAVTVDGESAAPIQASLWGFARSLAVEHPELRPVCMDLDPLAPASCVDQLAEMLVAGGRDDQLAWRAGSLVAGRLVPASTAPREPLELAVTQRGTLGNLVVRPAARRAPNAGEVEIRVHATGLNFRDVLNALGMYPGDPGPLGGECAGVVVAVGPGVTNVKVGDPVVAVAPGSFRTYVTCSAVLVAAKPATMTFAEAAGLLIANMTAEFALRHVGRLQAGERVLIHAGAGGVGLAAIALAQRVGAEVYATAGSASKRAFLSSLGVTHVYDSRSLAFGAEILADTGGEGVDVVLNSLAGDFVTTSLGLLRCGGRFLEIGKRDHLTADAAAGLGKKIEYHIVDWGDTALDDPQLVRSVLTDVVAAASAGVLRRVPLTTFPFDRAPDAFRFMAQARHTGKVVVTQMGAVADRPAPPIRPDATYLITGGLGGLGLATARHLAERGARHLLLLGRRPPSAHTETVLTELRGEGVEVVAVQGDVADRTDVERAVGFVAATMPALRGIFHAAGILDDGAVAQQTWARFGQVLTPKLAGAWLLHESTRQLELDHFVLFSSASAILGAPGQSSYTAANRAMGAVAHRRRAEGRPALSIDWGPWAEVGMAAGLGPREERRLTERGVRFLSPADALDALDLLLGHDAPQVCVLWMDWDAARRDLGGVALAAFLSEITSDRPQPLHDASEAIHDVAAALATADPADQLDLLEEFVEEQIASVAGLDPSDRIEPHRDLSELGMDSLMAVELTNRLRTGTGLALPSTVALEHPTLADLVDHLAAELGIGRRVASAPAGLAPVAPVGREEPLPVSSAQERLLFFDRFAPRVGVYNLPVALRLSGVLDVDAVRDAVVEVVRRHEALRTNFAPVDDGYVQVVVDADAVVVPWDVCDLGEAVLEDVLREEAARPFDLARDVKLRALLLRSGADEHVLALTVHHIAADGWSVSRVVGEIIERYTARVSGREPVLARLRVHYADYSVGIRQFEQSDVVQDQLAYWTGVLGGTLPVLELPGDRPRPAVQSFRSGS